MSWSANIPLLSHVNPLRPGLGASESRFTNAELVTGLRPGAGAGEAAGAAHRGVTHSVTTRNKQTGSWRNVIILNPAMA